MSGLVLHNFFRSSTSIRVRAALNLKGLSYTYQAHHLRKGEQRSADYLAINPQGLVPALVLDNGTTLTQSLAIIEYLDETYPEPPLLPADPVERAQVRALAYAIACEVHPLNNLKVLAEVKAHFGASEEAVAVWFRHWVAETFAPLEHMLASSPSTGDFCRGDRPGLADLCLYAQVVNNRRFDVDMTPYPTIRRIFTSCSALPAFVDAAPEQQPDAE